MGRRTAEQVWRGNLRGPLSTKANSANNQFSGITVLGSGSATVTVSTTAVKSNSIILMGAQANAAVNSLTGRSIEVKSIVDSSYFVLGTVDGVSMARDTNIGWLLFCRD